MFLYMCQKRENFQIAYKISGIIWRSRDGNLLHQSQYWTTVIGPCSAFLKTASQKKAVLTVSKNVQCVNVIQKGLCI